VILFWRSALFALLWKSRSALEHIEDMAVDSNKKWHKDYARRPWTSLLGNVGQLDLGPMGPHRLRLLLVQSAGHSGIQRASSSNSGEIPQSAALDPRGLEQSMGVAVSRGNEQGTARHRGALRKFAVWPR
jgi:hypothetical protein